jgi:hypothetical protein
MNERVSLAIGDTYHAVLKLIAAARMVTLTEMVEDLLCTSLRREFECDPRLALVVRELVVRGEQVEPPVRERTLNLLNVLLLAEGE